MSSLRVCGEDLTGPQATEDMRIFLIIGRKDGTTQERIPINLTRDGREEGMNEVESISVDFEDDEEGDLKKKLSWDVTVLTPNERHPWGMVGIACSNNSLKTTWRKPGQGWVDVEPILSP